MINAWAAEDIASHTIFLEDDVSVSPLFFRYASLCSRQFLSHHLRTDGMESHIIGCSLYTPRLDEISPTQDPQHPPKWNPSTLVGLEHKLVYYQLPWGAVYERNHWHQFVKYLKHRTDVYKEIEPVPNSRSNQWEKSWKRFLIEYMYAKSLVLVYPNFERQASFSTNYYEEGVHSVPEGMEVRIPDYLREDQDDRFNVPLLSKRDAQHVYSFLDLYFSNDSNPKRLKKMPLISLHRQLDTLERLVKTGQDWLDSVSEVDQKAYLLLSSHLY